MELNYEMHMEKRRKKLLFLSIILIAMFCIGAILYEKKPINSDLLFIEWIFYTLRKPRKLFISENRFQRIFWLLWYIAIALIVFSIGYQIQNAKAKLNKNAVIKNREAYLKIHLVYNRLKQAKAIDGTNFDLLLYRLKVIDEELSVETNFGYGDEELTLCENSINQLLDRLLDYTEKIDETDFQIDINQIFKIVSQIEEALEQRRYMTIK